MAFEQETDITKDRIGAFEIKFRVPDPLAVGEAQIGALVVEIVLSDESSQAKKYDLLARLQDDPAGLAHLANLASLRDYIRTRLNDEVLPV